MRLLCTVEYSGGTFPGVIVGYCPDKHGTPNAIVLSKAGHLSSWNLANIKIGKVPGRLRREARRAVSPGEVEIVEIEVLASNGA